MHTSPTSLSPWFSLSTPRGGEGRGEAGAATAPEPAHLTLPVAVATGPLPLPLAGGEGKFAGMFVCRADLCIRGDDEYIEEIMLLAIATAAEMVGDDTR
jgi:hypothetical protein